MTRLLLLGLLLGQWVRASPAVKSPDAHLRPAVFALTMVMIHDVVNPPAASRFYTYCLLGAHDIVAQQQAKTGASPSRLIHEFTPVPVETKARYDHRIAALYCILETGRLMLPSGQMLEEEEVKLLASLKKEGYAQPLIDQSVAVAQTVAKRVVSYSTTDNYRLLSARVRYRPLKSDGNWYPTPPGYIEAVEPHWRTIRPMMLDSGGQFKPRPPVAFSTDTSSAFFHLTREVYTVGKNLTDEQRATAAYWDCNPFAISTSGHLSIGFKKISPGGHWMNITGIVTEKAGLPFDQAVLAHSVVAMTLMDAFISCWDEKYRSQRIRPETMINRHLNPRWQPLLQTPPFPEYTSGHSVISTAVAEVLTYLIGTDFAFTDTTEVLFELPERAFTSFRQAAAQASISRLYGGIHYRDAIENGQAQGKAIGEFVVDKLRKAGVTPFH